jgi:hypothetical protein
MSSGESNEKENKDETIKELLENKNEMVKELFRLRLENENLQATRVESENQAVLLREKIGIMSKGIELLLEASGMPDHDTIASEFERLGNELDNLREDIQNEMLDLSRVVEDFVDNEDCNKIVQEYCDSLKDDCNDNLREAMEDLDLVDEDEVDEKIKTVEEDLEAKISDLTEQVNEFEGNNAFIECQLDDLLKRVKDLEGRKSKSIMEILLGWVR